MGLFSRLFNRGDGVRYIYIANDDPVAVDLDLAAIYKTQPNLQAVISFIADNIAQLSLKVYDRRDTNDRQRVLDSPAAKLLSGPVNPDMTSYEYVRTLVSDYLLYGRHIDLVIMDEDMPAGWQLRPIPVSWIAEYKDGTAFAPGPITVLFPSGREVDIMPDEYVLYKTYNPASPSKALSPVAALRNVLAEQIEAERYRAQVWKRGGRVSSVVSRPKDVEQFTEDQRKRFMESLKSAWTGDFASNGGGLMLLEDGMELKPYQVNAHEAQWAEAKKLSREDVAAIYHINPKMIWPGEGQTYASAKDNARALYADAMAPILKQLESRMNGFLLPAVGEPAGHYAEFDISGKLRGSFEEQAQVLYQAVGGPYMMPNEARGVMNLPSLGESFNSVYVPLNMNQVQTQAEPVEVETSEESDIKRDALNGAQVTSMVQLIQSYRAGELTHDQAVSIFMLAFNLSREDAESIISGGTVDTPKAMAALVKARADETPAQFKATAEQTDAEALTYIFRRFYERQRDSVLPKIGAKAEWWDAERWDNELTDDLYELAHTINVSTARKALGALGYDLPYSDEEAAAFILAMCRDRAVAINEVTLERLTAALESEDEEGELSTPQGVFENAIEERAESNGTTFATALVSFSAIDAARVAKRETGEEVTKTWVHNPCPNPRPNHVAMDGETVPFDEPFSNGMQWPGDMRTGVPGEIASCHCEVIITRP